ncbi:hypothetical protein AGMMS4956_04050 [Bacteroidia bacterium]|nr:hypothetical protein AGMMS4956_04050 [Bacteroidia bacterium]
MKPLHTLKLVFCALLCGVAIVLVLVAMLYFGVQHPKMQQYLVGEITRSISSQLHTQVSVQSVQFRPFNRLQVNGVLLQDWQGDTLLFAGITAVDVSHISIRQRNLDVSTLRIQDAVVFAKTDSAGNNNLLQIVQNLSKKDTTHSATPAGINFKLNHLIVDDVAFYYTSAASNDTSKYHSLSIHNLHLDANKISWLGDTLNCHIVQLSGKEKSGLWLKKMSADIQIASTQTMVSDLHLADEYSTIQLQSCVLRYAQLSDFDDFLNKVKFSATFNSSKIHLKSLVNFFPNLKPANISATLSGSVNAANNQIAGKNIKVVVGTSSFVTTLNWQGLSDPKTAFLSVDVRDVICNPHDLVWIDTLLKINNVSLADTSPFLQGNLTGHLGFSGTKNNFVVSCNLVSPQGNLLSNLSIKSTNDSTTHLQGIVRLVNVPLGTLLEQPKVGELNFNGNIDGKLLPHNRWNVKLTSEDIQLGYNDYIHNKLKINVSYENKLLRVQLLNADPLLQFELRGRAQWNEALPHYRGRLKVEHADLVQTRINTKDSVSYGGLSIAASATGNHIDNLAGVLEITDVHYVSERGRYKSAYAKVEVKQLDGMQHIALQSPMADAQLNVRGSLLQAPAILDSLLHLNSTPAKMAQNNKGTASQPPLKECTFWLKTKHSSKALSHFLPHLYIADSTLLQGKYENNILHLTFHSDLIKWKQIALQNLDISVAPRATRVLGAQLRAKNLLMGSTSLDSVIGTARLDSTGLLSKFTYRTTFAAGELRSKMQFWVDTVGNKMTSLHLFPTSIAIGDTLWRLQSSDIVMGNGQVNISQFRLENKLQFLQVNGSISNQQNDTLNVALNRIDIAPFLALTGQRTRLTGQVSGTFMGHDLFKKTPLFFSDLSINDFVYDKKPIGDLVFRSFTENNEPQVNLSVKVAKNQKEVLSVSAVMGENNELTGIADFNHAEVYYLEHLLTDILTEMKGTTSGRIKISGKPNHLLLNGQMVLENAQFAVTYLNTTYIAPEGTIFDFEDSHLKMKTLLAHDTKGQEGYITAELANITTPWNFWYNIDIDFKKYHTLNTNAMVSPIYYGQGCATGKVKMYGVNGQGNIDVVAQVDNGTKITIVLSEKSQMRTGTLINFVSQASAALKKAAPIETGANLDIGVNLAVNNDADLTIVLNPATNDVLTVNGDGNVKMEMAPAKNIFRFFGEYKISRGEYAFSIQNIVNKKFKIEPNSRIIFNGPIDAAAADIRASYSLRAPLAELFGDTTATSRYKRSYPINCKVTITGPITRPNLKFSIEAVGVDKELSDRMQAQLNTEDNVTIQFLSLLITNRFVAVQNDANSGNQNFGGTMGNVMMGEFLASQMGNFLSQLFASNIDISFNPRMGEDVEGFDGAIGFSRNLGERVIFSTNLASQSNRKTADATNSNFVGNVDFEVLVDKSGKFRIRIFGRTNDQYSEMMSGVANNVGSGGMGVVYQEEFNSFSELWNSMFKRKKKK